MRALSGAIITAGALIALGLTAVGIGSRYGGLTHYEVIGGEKITAENSRPAVNWEAGHVKIHNMDNGLILSLVFSGASVLIGLGITFVGLMYHHHRRYHEHMRTFGSPGVTTNHPVPTP